MKKLTLIILVIFGLLSLPVSSVSADDSDDSDYSDDHRDSDDHRHSNDFEHPDIFNGKLQPVVTAIDYHTRMIYLFNYKNDKVVTVDPMNINGWPGDIPLQHTMVMPGGDKFYVTTDNTEEHPAYIIALMAHDINWKLGTADLEIQALLPVDLPGTPAELPFVEAVNDKQAVPNWLLAQATQIHGPSILPYSDFVYFTDWTSDKARVINRETNEFAAADPISIPGYTEQSHGIIFNKSGTIGLGTGYFFDNSMIDRYKTNRETGELEPVDQIKLGNNERHAAFTHYVSWLDERYALTASMQFDKTSLTPPETEEIIPPSVWLIDAWEGTATKIIKHTEDVNGHGVFRSASDLAVIGDKLYIAEEDSIDHTFGEDGYLSVFDISDRFEPRFIKRFKPGEEFPQGYAVAHTLSPTPDSRYLLLASWVSGYVIKIDTLTDTVEKVWGPNDGLVMPHGLHSAGGIR